MSEQIQYKIIGKKPETGEMACFTFTIGLLKNNISKSNFSIQEVSLKTLNFI